MKRIILWTIVAMLFAMSFLPNKEKFPEYLKHDNVTYTFNSLDGEINFDYHWCLEDGLNELFNHPLFYKIDKRFLKKLTHIYHTDKTNEGVSLKYIVFGETFNIGRDSIKGNPYIYINTRIQHFLPTALKAIVWHEFVHLLMGKGGHCRGYDCPILTRAGSDSKIEDLIKEFTYKEKTLMLEYIIEKQKYWK